MNQNELRQTVFDVAPLRNVVGIGKATAYQIHVRRGPVIAAPVAAADFARRPAANDAQAAEARTAPGRGSLLRRLLRR
jgi:hypothetical protein